MIISSGYFIFASCSLLLLFKEAITVKLPTLPINIKKIITSLPTIVSVGVIPAERPTVPNADITSKVIVIKFDCSDTSVIDNMKILAVHMIKGSVAKFFNQDLLV